MRMIKGKDGLVTIISKEEAAVFNKIDFNNGMPPASLNEREAYHCDELFKKNVLRKTMRDDGEVVYHVYPQKHAL